MTTEPVGDVAAAGPDLSSRTSARSLFVVAILTGSFLLFLVQPMIARMALPRLGGAPAVWNSAMLVYQALLLGGYAYAHWLGRVSVKRQAMIHLGVLAVAALWLPIGLIQANPPPDAEPAIWVPWLLGASIGPLFFAVSAQAPLLQRWFAASAPAQNPYALYAASNVGSFGGLIAYPLVVEPSMALSSQSLLWSAGYALLCVLVALCAWKLPRGAAAVAALPTSAKPGARRFAHWVVLAFVPSGLMLATSTYLTTDIVAVPLLWVLPLGLYLLSFTVAFATGRRLADMLTVVAPLAVLMFGGTMIGGSHDYPFLNALLALLLLFMVAVALHTQMYRLRPEPDRLTSFYLAMSIGGALGGVFAGLIAPVIFDWTYEYPILILAAGMLAPRAFLVPVIGRLWEGDRAALWIRTAAVVALVAIIVNVGLFNPGNLLGPRHENIGFLALSILGLVTIGTRIPFVVVLAGALFLFGGYRALQLSIEGDVRTRSYFGVYTIRDYPAEGIRTLAHGTTLHGTQFLGDAAMRRTPTSYYMPGSGVGLAMQALGALYGPGARVGAVGLGTGTLACYAKPGQAWRFYEIDPTVIRMARDSQKFTFLSDCLPQADIVLGDARLSLAAQRPGSLDLLVLDAFSSDAVPMHLMTREAFATYSRVLAPKGLLLVHISNRFLDLEPVVFATVKGGGWFGAKLSYSPGAADNSEATQSDWIALSRDPGTLAALAARAGDWEEIRSNRKVEPWTDDYASIVPVIRSPLDEF
ncbi:fused MFS/spermidine synthase [Sphingomonas sp. 37zxx]|uniref:fused MFS/spermidine synthase n=1 Tax=Sphingomonas sp. 37zxx TaxID=1550073 RepID=UPI000ADE1E06|nr:fused MFS/spermidine synthase [Sphingomonas sp. 37zxx]